jgi:hypothetical protein
VSTAIGFHGADYGGSFQSNITYLEHAIEQLFRSPV